MSPIFTIPTNFCKAQLSACQSNLRTTAVTTNKYTHRGSSMHEKNIKQKTVKQLKKRTFPTGNYFTKKEKKGLASDVLNEVVRTY